METGTKVKRQQTPRQLKKQNVWEGSAKKWKPQRNFENRSMGRSKAGVPVTNIAYYAERTKGAPALARLASRDGMLGCWDDGMLGGWEVGRLGGWEVGRLGGGEVGRLGGWEVGRLGGWENFF